MDAAGPEIDLHIHMIAQQPVTFTPAPGDPASNGSDDSAITRGRMPPRTHPADHPRAGDTTPRADGGNAVRRLAFADVPRRPSPARVPPARGVYFLPRS